MRNKHLYPENWPELARACKEAANWQCERCGITHGDERESRRGNLYRVWLQAAHRDHGKRYDPESGLICLCCRCHWWYDFEHWQLESWRALEKMKHLALLTPERIAAMRVKCFKRALARA